MSVTIKDVAKAANISTSTVSRYLNNRTQVRPETADRIQAAIDQLRYIPNATARNLVLKQTDKLGVLVSSSNSIYWNCILKSVHTYISRSAEAYEIFTLNCDHTVLYNTNRTISDKIKILAEQRVAGIMLALRDIDQADIDYMFAQDIPFAAIQSHTYDERVSFVNVDNYEASYQATNYLIDLGHRHIAYVSGPTDAFFAKERLDGFRAALLEKKLYHKNLVLNGNNQYEDGYWRMKQILCWESMPSAVLFGNDDMAYGAMAAIQEAGLHIPADISIIGFDGLAHDMPIYKLLPPLTTIGQPMSLIGEKLAELMLTLIRDKELGIRQAYRIKLPTQLLEHGSCRAITQDE